MNPIVLVVDDMQYCIDMHVNGLAELGLTIVTASTLRELDVMYAKHREELAVIILDGCIPGDEVNTYGFITRVRADMESGAFTGHLVAASSLPQYRETMVRAGCTHQAPKKGAAELVLELLTITQEETW